MSAPLAVRSAGSTHRAAGRILRHALLILASLIFLLPFFWMLSTSLKSTAAVFAGTLDWIPGSPRWQNYGDVFSTIPFFTYLRNTLILCVANVAGTLFSCPLAAYAFSRLRWRGRDVVFFIMFASILLPAQVTLIPVYITFRNLHWLGTFLPLIVPSFLGSPFYIFLLRQFFLGMPQELSEAARLDGANDLTILVRLVVPLSKTALIAVALFVTVDTWKDFFAPLLYLNTQDLWTLGVGLQQFLSANNAQWNLLMAATILFCAPIFVLFFLLQRSFVEGISLTGLR
jgi:multiple sugar transport system permease protein